MKKQELEKMLYKPMVFLSHSHKDGDFATAFAKTLEDAFFGQIEVFNTSETEYSIREGWKITDTLVERMKDSFATLILVTPQSLNLPWIYFEMGSAFALKKYIIPCVAKGLSYKDLPPQLMYIQGADLTLEKDFHGIFEVLSRKCGKSYHTPSKIN